MKLCSFQHSNFVYIRNSLPIADAQSVFLVERMTSDVDANAWLHKSIMFWSNFCHSLVSCALRWLISHMCAVHTLLQYAIAGVHRGTKYLCWTPLYSILLGHGWASGRASGQLKYSDELLEWLSVWSEVQMICTWSSWFTATPPSLASLKSRMVYLSGASFVAIKHLDSLQCVHVCTNSGPIVAFSMTVVEMQ